MLNQGDQHTEGMLPLGVTGSADAGFSGTFLETASPLLSLRLFLTYILSFFSLHPWALACAVALVCRPQWTVKFSIEPCPTP